MAVLRSQDLSPESWCQALLNLRTPSPAWMIVESVEKCVFSEFACDQIPKRSYRGRIFSACGEWKWRRIDTVYRCVFLGSEDWSGLERDTASEEALSDLVRDEDRLFLWGKLGSGQNCWIEKSVPRRFEYPVIERAARVVLLLEQWRQPDTWEIMFTRYCGVQAIEEDEYANR